MTDAASDELHAIKWLIITALVVSVLVAVLVPTGYYLVDHRQDSRDAAELEERRIESCKAHNADQARNREFVVEDKRQMGLTFFGLTQAEIDALAPEFAEFAAFAAESFPYRACTATCVDAQFDPAVTDCPAPDNPEGKP